MNINKEDLESYADKILFDCLNEKRKVKIDITDRILLFNESQSENRIEIGKYAITLMLLFSCFSMNGKLFQRSLYYYYWACKSIIERKVGTCVFFLTKLREEICKNVDEMQWYAQIVHLDKMLYFIIGHETYHVLYAQNETIRQKAIDDIDAFLEDMYTNRTRTKDKLAERLLNNSLEFVMADTKFKEELACDKNSIAFLFKYVLDNNTIDIQKHELIYQQILDMVMMLQYDGINSSDFRSNMSKTNLKQFILAQHYGIFRIWVTAITIGETDKADVDVYSCLERTQNRYASIFSKKLRIRFREYGMANSNEKGQLTEGDLMIKYKHQLCLISDLINNMLVGEDAMQIA